MFFVKGTQVLGSCQISRKFDDAIKSSIGTFKNVAKVFKYLVHLNIKITGADELNILINRHLIGNKQ